MKYFAPILAGLLLALGGGVLIASAQTYVPLAKLPIGEGGSSPDTWTLTTYLSGAIKLLIAVAGALAVLMTIIGGAQYVAAGINPSAKSDARGRIENALIGLVLVLTSYLLLRSIDPRLVEFNLALPPISGTPAVLSGVTATPTAPAAEGTWPSDNAERAALAMPLPNAPSGIGINRANCPNIGALSCTSVSGLASDVIAKIRNLKSACIAAQGSCDVTITGGTEYWQHRSHNNSRRVDLSQSGSALNTYIRRTGRSSTTACGVPTDPHYITDGATYVDEPNRDARGNISGTGRHWHVCY